MTGPRKSLCPTCREGDIYRRKTVVRFDVGAVTFESESVARSCDNCNESLVAGDELRGVELRAAAKLAAAGVSSAKTLQFCRKTLGLQSAQLARMLGIEPETLSRWERGKRPIPLGAMAIVHALVSKAATGKSNISECLDALQNPTPLAGVVRL